METYGLLSKDFIFYHDILYVKNTYLIEICKIPFHKIADIAKHGKYFKSTGGNWFSYDLLSPEIIELARLPEKSTIIESIKSDKFEYSDEENPLYLKEMILLRAALEDSDIFIKHFKGYKINNNKLSGYCKSYAVLNLLIQFKHLKIYEKYNLYHAISDSEFSFQSNNADHFYEKYEDIIKYGIVQTITHKGTLNTNAKKVTKIHEALVGHFYRDGNKLSRRDILQKVNITLKLKNLQPISLTTVKRILLNNYNKNLDDMVRNGNTWTKNIMLPFLIRSEPENPGDHFQIDATRLQIYCKEGKKEGAFLWIAVVIDGYSRQVMGFAIADKETPNLYARALKSAFSRTDWLPAEILRDNYLGFTQDKELSDLIKQTENLGVIWRAHKVGNPRDKGIIESFNHIFNTIFCKNILGYTGEGIKSSNINARPNPEVLAALKKNKMLKNMDEVIVSITENIHNYNKKGTKNGKEPPLEKFRLATPKNTIELSTESTPLIFDKRKTIKLSRSTICLNVNGCAYFYHITDTELIVRFHDTIIQVRYNPDDMLLIGIFTEPESKFIGWLHNKTPIPLARVNQTSEDQSNLNTYFQENKRLIEELQQKIEERQSAIDALDLPPHVLESGFSGNLDDYDHKKEEKSDIGIYMPTQLPKDGKLKNNKIFTRYKTVYNEIQELLYKKKGTAKKL